MYINILAVICFVFLVVATLINGVVLYYQDQQSAELMTEIISQVDKQATPFAVDLKQFPSRTCPDGFIKLNPQHYTITDGNKHLTRAWIIKACNDEATIFVNRTN